MTSANVAPLSDEEFERWSQVAGENSGRTRLRKCAELMENAAYRDGAYRREHKLRNLFLELTESCNQRCRHCGSSCAPSSSHGALTLADYQRILGEVKQDFGADDVFLCITGGEPLLRPEFFDIMEYARDLGFGWGMTSNATLITPEVARRLYAAGMRTISVSVDGLAPDHEWFRRSPGSFRRTLDAIGHLVREARGLPVQVTTCVNRRNLGDLEELYALIRGMGVSSWRVINVEPIGRALEEPDLLLEPGEFAQMIDFIKRNRHADSMPVTFGCSHYLGIDLERETRGWYFLCSAGCRTASIAANGDVLACLDIERRPELVQGNVLDQRFSDVWNERFEVYRGDFRKVGKCAECFDYQFCAGDSFHTWDFDAMEPRLCLKGVLF